MKWTTDNLRKAFLDYFASKDHRIIPGASLNPASYGDPTTLLTTAGMQPLVPYFKGEQASPHPRLASCQKCCRSDDLNEVGYTSRHQTFFEMLGNFSFGDYFKVGAIEYGWEFMTDVLGVDKEILWASVYEEDDEAFEIWNNRIGMPAERIHRYDKKENWWGPVGKTGPCGPCSEINFDRGPEFGCGHPDCKPNCPRCERFVEVWNLVFQQFNQQEDGSLPPLPAAGVDTGMGLERLAAVMQGVPTNHDIEIIWPICLRISELAVAHAEPQGGEQLTRSGLLKSAPPSPVDPRTPPVRIIADHARAMTFLAADGIVPSNEGRGYVMRRVLRRASRFGRQLGIEGTFLHAIVPTVIDLMKKAYPELLESHERIARLVRVEEEKFHEALEQGMSLLEELIEREKSRGSSELSGFEVFRLYDTYGFPRELTSEVAREHGMQVNDAEFDRAMEVQRTRTRSASGLFEYGERMGIRERVPLEALGPQPFVGYERTEHETEIVWLGESGEDALIVLAETPFYGEAGGQVGDTGILVSASGIEGGGKPRVRDTVRDSGVIVHIADGVAATWQPGDLLKAVVDSERRHAITRAHSATHLLHAALRMRLGTHVAQAGSLVEPDRLRFDFTHFGTLSDDDIHAIEEVINDRVLESILVETLVDVPIEDARKMGAMMLFGEKYGDHVRVVRIGNFSTELCGGTHTQNTSQVGFFKMVSQSSVGANLRRVECVTGRRAWEWVQNREALIHSAAQRLEISPESLGRSIDRLLEETKRLQRLLESTQRKIASSQADEIAAQAKAVSDTSLKYVAQQVDGLGPDALRSLADQIAEKIRPGVAVLGSLQDSKVLLVAKATPDAVEQGAHAGNLIREIARLTGGGGGGRADFAQAGGRQPEKLSEALAAVPDLVRAQLK